MPELPDLQVFASNLNRKLAGKKTKKLSLKNKRRLNVSEKKLKQAIEGSMLKKVYREGKELHFSFSNNVVLGLHLMLHGRLHLIEKMNEQKHTILEIFFENGQGLALADYQGAATPTLDPEEKTAPDALSKELNYDYLKNLLAKKRTNIKTFLLDQKIIRGIGNAYADEILWQVRISPLSVCNKIPPNKIKQLAKAIPTVLKNAEKQIRKINPDIISGEERSFLKIHNSQRKKSPTGGMIQHTKINSRITYYTDEQKLFK